MKIFQDNAPRQENGYDCGLFVVEYCRVLANESKIKSSIKLRQQLL